jgi:hypothetical protein
MAGAGMAGAGPVPLTGPAHQPFVNGLVRLGSSC